MYVFEEMINGKKLTEIINETHENVKYLPGHKLPENIVSVSHSIRYQLFIFLVFVLWKEKKMRRKMIKRHQQQNTGFYVADDIFLFWGFTITWIQDNFFRLIIF